MAFGRKKQGQHEAEHSGEIADPEAAAAGEPDAGSPVTTDVHEAPGGGSDSFAAPSDDLTEAAAYAGDPAAAGVDAHGTGSDLPGDTSTHEVAGAAGAPSAGSSGAATDPETVGSVASSPDPAAAPAGYGGDGASSASGGASDDEDGGVADSAGAAVASAQSLVEARPEVLVGAAFVGGLVLARVLSALGGDR